MLDQNDLKAIAELMDLKLEKNNEVLRAEMKENNEVLLNRVDRKLEENNEALLNHVDRKLEENNEALLNHVDMKLEENNTALINQFNAVIESTVMPEIRAVAEGHQIILDRLPEVDKVGDLEDRVSTLEHIVQMQRQELNALKGA